MSGFFNETNYGRILKMCEMLEGPMTKSAKANKATPEQWGQMLDPLVLVIDALRCEEFDTPPLSETTEATPPVEREMSSLEHLTTQQLVDRMIAYGAALANRRN